MKVNALPKATSIDQDKGMLLYCEDGHTLKQIAASLFDGGGGTVINYYHLFTNNFEYEYLNEHSDTTKELTWQENASVSIPI